MQPERNHCNYYHFGEYAAWQLPGGCGVHCKPAAHRVGFRSAAHLVCSRSRVPGIAGRIGLDAAQPEENRQAFSAGLLGLDAAGGTGRLRRTSANYHHDNDSAGVITIVIGSYAECELRSENRTCFLTTGEAPAQMPNHLKMKWATLNSRL